MNGRSARKRWFIIGNLALLLLGLLQITGTYFVFSHTWDEPAHIAAGMQLLDRGEYSYELHHPPLARLATALGPYLAGSRASDEPNMWQEGWRLLYDSGDYERNLTLARLGILPFFILLAVITCYWANQLSGRLTATLAGFFLVTQPAIVAHAGLATTDLPMAALAMCSLLCFVLWLEKPTPWRSGLLGIATGLAFMSKFSAIPFLAGAFLSVILYRWLRHPGSWNPALLVTRRRLGHVLLSLGFLFTTAWAVFGFGWTGYPQSSSAVAAGKMSALSMPVVLTATMDGIKQVAEHNSQGHYSFLLGEWRHHGWWYFFPVALAVKTTLPLLICATAGFVVAVREGQRTNGWKTAAPGIMVLSIMLFAIMANINIGVRHILLIYPLLVVQAAVGVLWLLKLKKPNRTGVAIVAFLLAWQGWSTLTAHPDYLAWFNELAGPHPEHILIDSDLDWGQDLKRLSSELQARDIEYTAIAYNGFARLDQHNLPPNYTLKSGEPVTGWVAISLLTREADRGHHWIRKLQPETRVGKSIFLYFVDPTDLPASERAQARMREALFVRYTLANDELALQLFEDVLRLNPRHYGALWQRASALQDLGHLDLADSAWKIVLQEAQRTGYAGGEADAHSRLEKLRQARQQRP